MGSHIVIGVMESPTLAAEAEEKWRAEHKGDVILPLQMHAESVEKWFSHKIDEIFLKEINPPKPFDIK